MRDAVDAASRIGESGGERKTDLFHIGEELESHA
jgi:hypothetical protein